VFPLTNQGHSPVQSMWRFAGPLSLRPRQDPPGVTGQEKAPQGFALTILVRKGKLPNSRTKLRPGWAGERRAWIVQTMSTAMRVSYRMDSTLESVNQAEEVATKIAAKIGFDEEDVNRISMAVREAAVNAVLHGNAYDPAKKVTFGFENTGEALVITVSDEGKGLNPNTIPDPLAPENLLKQSGRGIFLIRAFMDEVRIRSLEPGTEVTMIKNVHGGNAAGKEESK
jgi:serine/threonine-protein kinase RsbW